MIICNWGQTAIRIFRTRHGSRHIFIHPSHSEKPSGATHSDVIKVLAEPFHLTNNPESFNLFAKFQVLRTQNSLKRLSETPAASVNIFSTNKEDFPLYYLL